MTLVIVDGTTFVSHPTRCCSENASAKKHNLATECASFLSFCTILRSFDHELFAFFSIAARRMQAGYEMICRKYCVEVFYVFCEQKGDCLAHSSGGVAEKVKCVCSSVAETNGLK
jgi:hypothetical protein